MWALLAWIATVRSAQTTCEQAEQVYTNECCGLPPQTQPSICADAQSELDTCNIDLSACLSYAPDCPSAFLPVDGCFVYPTKTGEGGLFVDAVPSSECLVAVPLPVQGTGFSLLRTTGGACTIGEVDNMTVRVSETWASTSITVDPCADFFYFRPCADVISGGSIRFQCTNASPTLYSIKTQAALQADDDIRVDLTCEAGGYVFAIVFEPGGHVAANSVLLRAEDEIVYAPTGVVEVANLIDLESGDNGNPFQATVVISTPHSLSRLRIDGKGDTGAADVGINAPLNHLIPNGVVFFDVEGGGLDVDLHTTVDLTWEVDIDGADVELHLDGETSGSVHNVASVELFARITDTFAVNALDWEAAIALDARFSAPVNIPFATFAITPAIDPDSYVWVQMTHEAVFDQLIVEADNGAPISFALDGTTNVTNSILLDGDNATVTAAGSVTVAGTLSNTGLLSLSHSDQLVLQNISAPELYYEPLGGSLNSSLGMVPVEIDTACGHINLDVTHLTFFTVDVQSTGACALPGGLNITAGSGAVTVVAANERWRCVGYGALDCVPVVI